MRELAAIFFGVFLGAAGLALVATLSDRPQSARSESMRCRAARDLEALIELRPGAVYATRHPAVIWQRGPLGRTLLYRPIPNPRQAREVDLFADLGTDTTTTTIATTTTTQGGKQR